MKTYTGANSGSYIEPLLSNAKESIWIISPWIGSTYVKQLASLSQRGIEVRIVTTNVEYNGESLEIIKASENPNLIPLVLDQERAAFIHSKIYIVDKNKAVSGSANLTYSGLNKNVESLSIAESKDEVEQIETDFMRVWMNFERKRMSNEELTNEKSFSLKNALPLSTPIDIIGDYSGIKDVELVYRPYYFFEFSFRATAGKSPPILFENSGFVMLDALKRKIVHDNLLDGEISDHSTGDYYIKTGNKYRLSIHQSVVRDFREARELVLDHIIKKNTVHYTQNYRSGSYDKIFVPYRNIIRFIKTGFVQVPIWYIEKEDPDGRKHQDLVFGASRRKWGELLYCPDCQTKVWISQAVTCQMCGKQFCPRCINTVGLIFRKKLCRTCEYQARNK